MATKAKVTRKPPWQVQLIVLANCILMFLGVIYAFFFIPARYSATLDPATLEGVKLFAALFVLALIVGENYLVWKGKKIGLLIEGVWVVLMVVNGGFLWGFIKSGLLLSTASRKYFGVMPDQGVK